MHALIIEQEMWIIFMIEDVLRELGYSSFTHASSHESAVGAARTHRPDLITADIHLGGGSGVDAVIEICAASPTPVVFVTATPWEARASISDAVIVAKPFGEQDLREGVARAMSM